MRLRPNSGGASAIGRRRWAGGGLGPLVRAGKLRPGPAHLGLGVGGSTLRGTPGESEACGHSAGEGVVTGFVGTNEETEGKTSACRDQCSSRAASLGRRPGLGRGEVSARTEGTQRPRPWDQEGNCSREAAARGRERPCAAGQARPRPSLESNGLISIFREGPGLIDYTIGKEWRTPINYLQPISSRCVTYSSQSVLNRCVRPTPIEPMGSRRSRPISRNLSLSYPTSCRLGTQPANQLRDRKNCTLVGGRGRGHPPRRRTRGRSRAGRAVAAVLSFVPGPFAPKRSATSQRQISAPNLPSPWQG